MNYTQRRSSLREVVAIADSRCESIKEAKDTEFSQRL
jgi:hypothetical protein